LYFTFRQVTESPVFAQRSEEPCISLFNKTSRSAFNW
jgi:hypothetical protein